MKKLLPLLFLGITLASCSKKGDDPAPTPIVTPTPVVKPTLIGSWIGTNMKVVGIGADTKTNETYVLGPTDYNIEFTVDNKLIETFDKVSAPPNGYTQTSTYTYSNGIIVAKPINTTTPTTATYKVESLTNNALVLSYDIPPAGSSLTERYTVTFARQ
jgi:hypothetical protein